jgi:hypothetical protein
MGHVTEACVALDTRAESAFSVAQEDLLRAHVSRGMLFGCRRNTCLDQTTFHMFKYVSGIVIVCVRQSQGVNEGEKISAGHSPNDRR